MDYQQFVSTQFSPRTLAMQNGLKGNLVAAGVANGSITVTEVSNVEGVNDLRYRITATRGGRTFTGYIELTASGFIDNEMAIVITLWCDGNGNQITSSYSSGNPVKYTDALGIEGLLNKITNLENLHTGELLTAARAFLRV